jgi:hypothetical protein
MISETERRRGNGAKLDYWLLQSQVDKKLNLKTEHFSKESRKHKLAKSKECLVENLLHFYIPNNHVVYVQ